MPKYYVRTGKVQEVIVAQDPRQAACLVLHKVSSGGSPLLSKIIHVSELGFGIHDDDDFFDTITLLDDMEITWRKAKKIKKRKKRKPVPKKIDKIDKIEPDDLTQALNWAVGMGVKVSGILLGILCIALIALPTFMLIAYHPVAAVLTMIVPSSLILVAVLCKWTHTKIRKWRS